METSTIYTDNKTTRFFHIVEDESTLKEGDFVLVHLSGLIPFIFVLKKERFFVPKKDGIKKKFFMITVPKDYVKANEIKIGDKYETRLEPYKRTNPSILPNGQAGNS